MEGGLSDGVGQHLGASHHTDISRGGFLHSGGGGLNGQGGVEPLDREKQRKYAIG